ncbi:MAG: hypothetical protein ABI626_07065 [Sphingomicrobium sp.]
MTQPFEHWGEFYLLAGSAAAVLIGLIFVVITLMHDRSRSSVLFGSRLYMGPIVLHMCFVLALSGAALAPGVTTGQFAAMCGAIALWGLARGLMSTLGIRRLSGEDQPHWTDLWFYGIIPAAIYLALGAVALAVQSGAEWAERGVGAVVVALILLSVRNEWDLVTWLAPRADGASAKD